MLMSSCILQLENEVEVEDRSRTKSELFKAYQRSLNSISCMMIILISNDPFELQPFKVKTLA
jgi:hypothetical protein